MRIPCPYCGGRDSSEFSYLGDATLVRPRGDLHRTDGGEAMHDYVYLRDNPAGPLDEFWYHAGGCRAWLVLRRDTVTHEILNARLCAGRSAV